MSDNKSLPERVGSCFENGYGDEEWNVKLMYWTIMLFLFIISGGLVLIVAIPWYVWRLKSRKPASVTVEGDKS